MTPAEPTKPQSALTVLFGEGEDACAALAKLIVSADADGPLSRALDKLPGLTRQTACNQVAEAAAGLLDVNLIDDLIAGWREQRELTSAAQRTLAVPGSTELIDIYTHEFTMERHPHVTVLVDDDPAATLQLGLCVVFAVTALLAGISAGRLVALHSGRCDITATLSIPHADVITGRAQLDLPGVIRLSPGIRLLPADNYPPPDQQADSPANGDARASAS